MTTTTPDAVTDPVADRHRRLAEAMQALRGRAAGHDAARILLVAGAILVPLGVCLIILGWAGAARSVDVWEQIPYFISGGILGLALVVAGGFCYFTSWQTQLVRAAKRDADDARAVLAALERIESLLREEREERVATDPTPARRRTRTS